jgi:hypothetical protein
MQKTIKTVPENEKELVRIRSFIKESREVTQYRLMELLKDVMKH